MGEANNRGTREERIAQAIERQKQKQRKMNGYQEGDCCAWPPKEQKSDVMQAIASVYGSDAIMYRLNPYRGIPIVKGGRRNGKRRT